MPDSDAAEDLIRKVAIGENLTEGDRSAVTAALIELRELQAQVAAAEPLEQIGVTSETFGFMLCDNRSCGSIIQPPATIDPELADDDGINRFDLVCQDCGETTTQEVSGAGCWQFRHEDVDLDEHVNVRAVYRVAAGYSQALDVPRLLSGPF